MLLNRNNTKIYRSREHKKYYYLEQTIFRGEAMEQIRESIGILSSRSTKNKILVEVLEVFNKNMTANYYKLDVGVK